MKLTEIHDLEVREEYPRVIDELESLLQANPDDAEVVTQLGFNLWFAVVEAYRMRLQLPVEKYAKRFVDLFRQYESALSNNADFCWAFGLGIALFWHNFAGVTEEEGRTLKARAGQLDPFWAGLHDGRTTQDELCRRLAGRGVLAEYYAVEQSPAGNVLKAAPEE